MCSEENQVNVDEDRFGAWIALPDLRTVAVLTIAYLFVVLASRWQLAGNCVEVEALPATTIPLLVDVNRAGAYELSLLPGIGPSLAERVARRRRKKPFAYIEELREIEGIGPKTLDRLRPLVICGPLPSPSVETVAD